jgi:hypothetical protein
MFDDSDNWLKKTHIYVYIIVWVYVHTQYTNCTQNYIHMQSNVCSVWYKCVLKYPEEKLWGSLKNSNSQNTLYLLEHYKIRSSLWVCEPVFPASYTLAQTGQVLKERDLSWLTVLEVPGQGPASGDGLLGDRVLKLYKVSQSLTMARRVWTSVHVWALSSYTDTDIQSWGFHPEHLF